MPASITIQQAGVSGDCIKVNDSSVHHGAQVHIEVNAVCVCVTHIFVAEAHLSMLECVKRRFLLLQIVYCYQTEFFLKIISHQACLLYECESKLQYYEKYLGFVFLFHCFCVSQVTMGEAAQTLAT